MFLIACAAFAVSILGTPHDPRLDCGLKEPMLGAWILASILLCIFLQAYTVANLAAWLCRVLPAGILLGQWTASILDAARLKEKMYTEKDEEKVVVGSRLHEG